MSAVIRKIVTVVEETHLEMGQKVAPPTRRAAAIAVIENPFAGRYVEDLSPLIAIFFTTSCNIGPTFDATSKRRTMASKP